MDFNEFVGNRMEGMMESYEKTQLSKELYTLQPLAEAIEAAGLDEEYDYLSEGKLAKAFGGDLDDFLANKKIKDMKMGKKSFLNYLKKKYPEFQESEITGARTKEEMDAVREKYIGDFKNWAKLQGHLQGMGWKYLMTAAAMFVLPAAHLYFTLCFWSSAISWWKTKKKIKKGKGLNHDYSHVEDDDRSFN